MPAYLKGRIYANPSKIDDGPFQYAHGTEIHFFVWLGQHPAYLENFNDCMAGYRQGKPSWITPGKSALPLV